MKLNNDEIADIKNKLQSSFTVLELLKGGEEPSGDIVKIAYQDLQKVISMLNEKQEEK